MYEARGEARRGAAMQRVKHTYIWICILILRYFELDMRIDAVLRNASCCPHLVKIHREQKNIWHQQRFSVNTNISLQIRVYDADFVKLPQWLKNQIHTELI